jgi:hypothetical protein
MKKVLYKLMTVCMLAMSIAAATQSNHNVKQDRSKQGQMKHDDMGIERAFCPSGTLRTSALE